MSWGPMPGWQAGPRPADHSSLRRRAFPHPSWQQPSRARVLHTGLRGDMNDRRMNMVRKAYGVLDSSGDGVVTLGDIMATYSVEQHPEVQAGKKTPEEVFKVFLDSFEGPHGCAPASMAMLHCLQTVWGVRCKWGGCLLPGHAAPLCLLLMRPDAATVTRTAPCPTHQWLSHLPRDEPARTA